MKKTFIFTILTVFAVLFSAQFEIVKDVYEETNSITAQQYGYKDHNGDFVAILKVKTDIEDLAFKSMTLDKSEYMGNGIYHVYMQPGSRMLEFMKTGFISVKHQFPRQLESNKVYIIEVKGVGEEKKIENIIITIQTVPSGGEIYFDGKDLGFVEQIETVVGPHEIMIKRNGYEDKTTNIQVSAKNNYFRIDLVPLPGTIQLNKIEKPVDYSGSGMFFSIETGLYLDNEIRGDNEDIQLTSNPGKGFGLNSNVKISEKFDALIKIRLFSLRGDTEKPTLSEVDTVDINVYEAMYGSISGGIKLKFNNRVYLYCDAGMSLVILDGEKYEYVDDDGFVYNTAETYDYDSWDFIYSGGIGYEYQRLDMFLNVSTYMTDRGIIIIPGLALGYKFWIFKK